MTSSDSMNKKRPCRKGIKYGESSESDEPLVKKSRRRKTNQAVQLVLGGEASRKPCQEQQDEGVGRNFADQTFDQNTSSLTSLGNTPEPMSDSQPVEANRPGRKRTFVNHIEGYPSVKEIIPAGLSNEKICREYPNHLLGERLNSFLGVWTAYDIFKAMPKTAQAMALAKKSRYNFLQKRITVQIKRLKKAGRLTDVVYANLKREGKNWAVGVPGLLDGPHRDRRARHGIEKGVSSDGDNFSGEGELWLENDYGEGAAQQACWQRLEEDDGKMMGSHLATNRITDESPVQADPQTTNETWAASSYSNQYLTEATNSNMQMDGPIFLEISREEVESQRFELQNRLQQATHAETASDMDAISILLAFINNEVQYQLLVLEDVLWVDPRVQIESLDGLEQSKMQFWCEEMKLWKTDYKSKHGRGMDISLPTPRTITNLLNHQASIIKQIVAPEVVEYFQAVGERYDPEMHESIANAEKRRVLLEQAEAIKSFTYKWQKMLLDFAKYNQSLDVDRSVLGEHVFLPLSEPAFECIDPADLF